MFDLIVIKNVVYTVKKCNFGVPFLYKALCFRPISQQFLNVCSGDAAHVTTT
jgi:hypothetical protein